MDAISYATIELLFLFVCARRVKLVIRYTYFKLSKDKII